MSYFFSNYLIPQYLLKNKRGQFVLYTLYAIIISFFFINISILYGLSFLEHLQPERTAPITKTLLIIILGVYFVVVIFSTIMLVLNSFKTIVKNEDLKNKFLETQLQLKEQELKFLKMQIHPHFLFNSLNTIYGYALRKGDEAPKMILKLSNLLDYILYQVDKPLVSLQNEIKHLQDYISLEKMRFHDTLQVDIKDETHSQNIEIAPMLLIPFVENSFKHGAIQNGKLSVHIDISLQSDTLYFSVENSYKANQNPNHGIGLDNIKKRLNMLYPNAHSLKITEGDDTFKIELSIQTNQLKPVIHES